LTGLRRAFVAVVPPADVLDAVGARVDEHRHDADGLRWTRREQWHCTLQFLGAVGHVDALVAALGAAARVTSSLVVQLSGAGAFPSPARATVLWLGVSRGELGELVSAVEDATGPLGFGREPRPFRPHVTVARAPRPRDLTELATALGGGPTGPWWTVDEIVLLESDTRPDGAVHHEVARIPLDG
jgi:RNA 2',3'-cyclic 3'-phosphodiesterase